MINNPNKEKIIKDFIMMKEFEESARDLYLKVHSDVRVKNEEIKKTFKRIAEDEQQHCQIVQKIISIVEANL